MGLDGFMAGCLSAIHQTQSVQQVGFFVYAPVVVRPSRMAWCRPWSGESARAGCLHMPPPGLPLLPLTETKNSRKAAERASHHS